MNGNVSRAGITADLEAMKKIGLGGAQIFNVSESIPEGKIIYNSEEWRGLVKFAAEEARRLGLELCIHNCAGWSSSGGPWVTPEHAMQTVTTSEVEVTGPVQFATALEQPPTKAGFYRDIAVLAFPTPKDDMSRIADYRAKALYDYKYGLQPAMEVTSPDATIAKGAIVDLTSKLGQRGVLAWEVPPGRWTIMRIGYTPTGAVNAPAPTSGRGLEVDKLSREAFDAYWAGGMGPLLKELGPLAGSTLNNCLVDSYEVGCQNWTEKLREEFTKRRGYDPLFFLPAMTGRTVESGPASERFLWDLRRTIGDLFTDNYYSYFAELCKKNGLLSSVEPYDGPFECTQVGRDADIVMGEFWVNGGMSSSCKLAASVAHVYGKKIIGAESFTAEPSVGKWMNHPRSLKAVGDLMYTSGINRYIIHRYAHQPWSNVEPGMTMGQWGTHFERTTTWWDQGSAWVSYLTRCQYLLQQGKFAADVLCFAGEAAPNGAPFETALKAKGYDYDACGADVILNRVKVSPDGSLVLPDGMTYRVLTLPDTPFMTPRLVKKVAELVEQGAVVIGPKPLTSPSSEGGSIANEEVARLGAVVWGDCDGQAVKEHRHGKGRVVWGKAVDEVLAEMGRGPDCEFSSVSGAKPKAAWIHRMVTLKAGPVDVYFVSNQRPISEEMVCSFRITGRRPELWDAVTGTITPAPVWSETSGRTVVPVRLGPSGSVFVVFRGDQPVATEPHLVAVNAPMVLAEQRKIPKIEIKKAVYEAIDGAGSADVTAKVAAEVQGGTMEIPASNGLFGDPAYLHVKRLRVDYMLDGKPMSKAADENAVIVFFDMNGPDVPAGYRLAVNAAGKTELQAFRVGVYDIADSGGGTAKIEVKSVPAAVEVRGPWAVKFQERRGAPKDAIKLDVLGSWTEMADPAVKYFSGTAEYVTEFDIPADATGPGKGLRLSLGSVKEIAEVTLNGKDLGVWWTPPFEADVTGVIKAGKNTLKVRVTNLWVNRLIGDEQFADDSEWNGKPIKKWPDWFHAEAEFPLKDRPSKERATFTTWKHWTKDSLPMESGLLGPVSLRVGVSQPINGR